MEKNFPSRIVFTFLVQQVTISSNIAVQFVFGPVVVFFGSLFSFSSPPFISLFLTVKLCIAGESAAVDEKRRHSNEE